MKNGGTINDIAFETVGGFRTDVRYSATSIDNHPYPASSHLRHCPSRPLSLDACPQHPFLSPNRLRSISALFSPAYQLRIRCIVAQPVRGRVEQGIKWRLNVQRVYSAPLITLFGNPFVYRGICQL